MSLTNLHGRDMTDPEVHEEVMNSIRQMPFRDLVAAIEGEEAAAAMEASSTTPLIVGGISMMAVNINGGTVQSGLSGRADGISMSCPPAKRG